MRTWSRGWRVIAAAGTVAVGLALLAVTLVGGSRFSTGWMALTERPTAAGLSEVRLLEGGELLGQPRLSPDGKLVAWVEFEERPGQKRDPDELPAVDETEWDAYLTVAAAEGGSPRRVGRLEGPQVQFEGNQFAWARNSRSVVYARTERAEDNEYRVRISSLSVSSGQESDLALLTSRHGSDGVLPWEVGLALSPDGRQAAMPVSRRLGSGWQHDLAIVDLASGRPRPLGLGQPQVALAAVSWEGDRLYFTVKGASRKVGLPDAKGNRGTAPTFEIWSVRQDGKDMRRETSGHWDEYPAPRPGGKELAFVRGGSICLLEESGRVRTLVEVERGGRREGHSYGPISWSPTGEEIAFVWLGKRTGAPGVWVGRVE